jgi:hypothetical protein
MDECGSLPRARQDGLIEEAVGEELLLYDQESHTAHCLSPIAARVWRHCDGEHDLTRLAVLAGASKDLVADALHELREKDLLDVEPELTQSTVPGESRREAIGRVARYGAAAATVPLVVSATAATPAMASSGETTECCQCFKGIVKCGCTTKMTDKECQKFCEGLTACKGGASIESSLATGSNCKNTTEC